MLATENSTRESLGSLISQAGRSRSGFIVWQARRPVVLARRSRQVKGTIKLAGVGQSANGSTVDMYSAIEDGCYNTVVSALTVDIQKYASGIDAIHRNAMTNHTQKVYILAIINVVD